MYQSNNNDLTEEDFNELVDNFEKLVLKFTLDELSIKFDMNSNYKPTWACIWNKPKNIGRSCRIFQKNSKLALVIFNDEEKILKEDIINHLYRIEDLTKL